MTSNAAMHDFLLFQAQKPKVVQHHYFLAGLVSHLVSIDICQPHMNSIDLNEKLNNPLCRC